MCGLAMLVLASPVAPDRVGKRLPVFTWSKAGNSAFRDPAMLYSPPPTTGKLLAFSEAEYSASREPSNLPYQLLPTTEQVAGGK